MLYLSIDLHRKQMTISLRDEEGTALLNRQVSAWGAEPVKFLEQVAQRAGSDGYLAILEVCGFHDWLAELLPEHGCREVVLIQAEKKSRRKTDRRDANQLGELWWLNRRRLQAGQAAPGLRRVVPPTPDDRDDRRLTQWRSLVTRQLTQLVNRVRSILRRLNIEQNCPTKGIQTRRARAWLEEVALEKWIGSRWISSWPNGIKSSGSGARSTPRSPRESSPAPRSRRCSPCRASASTAGWRWLAAWEKSSGFPRRGAWPITGD